MRYFLSLPTIPVLKAILNNKSIPLSTSFVLYLVQNHLIPLNGVLDGLAKIIIEGHVFKDRYHLGLGVYVVVQLYIDTLHIFIPFIQTNFRKYTKLIYQNSILNDFYHVYDICYLNTLLFFIIFIINIISIIYMITGLDHRLRLSCPAAACRQG